MADLDMIAKMMRAMYLEVQPTHSVYNILPYINEVRKCFRDPKQTIYVDEEYRGFFIVVDETEAMTPTLPIFNGTRVYITSEHRQSRLLAQFYDRLFTDFNEGIIIGVTDINSKHIKVLDKRHSLIAKVYELNRSK